MALTQEDIEQLREIYKRSPESVTRILAAQREPGSAVAVPPPSALPPVETVPLASAQQQQMPSGYPFLQPGAGVPPELSQPGGGQKVASYTVKFDTRGQNVAERFSRGQLPKPAIDLPPSAVTTEPAATVAQQPQAAAVTPPTGFQKPAPTPATLGNFFDALRIGDVPALAQFARGKYGFAKVLLAGISQGRQNITENDRTAAKKALIEHYKIRFNAISPNDVQGMLRERMNFAMDTAALEPNEKAADTTLERMSKAFGVNDPDVYTRLIKFQQDEEISELKKANAALKSGNPQALQEVNWSTIYMAAGRGDKAAIEAIRLYVESEKGIRAQGVTTSRAAAPAKADAQPRKNTGKANPLGLNLP